MKSLKFKGDSGKNYVGERVTPGGGESDIFIVRSMDEVDRPLRVMKSFKNQKREAAFEEEKNRAVYLRGCPGVVQLYDFAETRLSLFYEFIDGGDLGALIQEVGPGNFAFQQSVALLASISGILSYIHSLGIVHRDLKPENILLSNKAKKAVIKGRSLDKIVNPEEIKLCDFSFSLQNRNSKLHDMTEENRLMGTPGYIPPEILTNKDKRGNEKTDVWCLSTIGYEMLSRVFWFSRWGGFSIGKSSDNSQNYKVMSIDVKEKEPPKIERGLRGYEKTLYGMRRYLPEERPTMQEVHIQSMDFVEKFRNPFYRWFWKQDKRSLT